MSTPPAHCPYCHNPVVNAEAHFCPTCKTPHHPECWQENGDGCAVALCTAGPKLPPLGTPQPESPRGRLTIDFDTEESAAGGGEATGRARRRRPSRRAVVVGVVALVVVIALIGVLVGTKSSSSGSASVTDEPAATAIAAPAADSSEGRRLFIAGNPRTGATACGSCHALGEAGTTAQTGPSLDHLRGWSVAQIREAILDPGKEIATGYAAGVMPADYPALLTSAETDAIASYLVEVSNA